ncbi:S-adenosyl-L-methionine-dependent methyltransferase [Echria macrotheca]|uniref:S-adenosyl-L-methionine-dependent methyltransferase n=1 Tax=Echria macrotheca TaxID=438768 RepID=A0AAJ0FFJ9_9PEZI|nr:S-adenosyl-L-methionine-dependent methyltransferase [Echria macrotheca]
MASNQAPHPLTSNPVPEYNPPQESNQTPKEDPNEAPKEDPKEDPDKFAKYDPIAASYATIESRIAWDFLCGGNRHFAYYPSPSTTLSPFPISAGQKRMQTQLLHSLSLPPYSHILDAGCGDGHVAIDLAQRGPFVITAFDVVPRHVSRARHNVSRAHLSPSCSIQILHLDFDSLPSLPSQTYHGIYTSESLLHATSPSTVLSEFFRLLKPGGRLVLHEYHNDYMSPSSLPGFPATLISERHTGESAFTRAERYFRHEMEQAGFEDIQINDYSANIEPMARLLSLSGAWRHVVLFLRLQKFFPNSAKREEGFAGRESWAYVSVRGTKPGVLEVPTEPQQ